MFSSSFLPLAAGLEIATTSMHDDLLVVQVISTKARSCCPLCFCPAERCHSQYTRVVADLSCAGFRIQLILHVLKNLGGVLEGMLARHLAAHRSRVAGESKAIPLSTAHAIQPPKLSPKEAQLKQAKREERLAEYQHIMTLQKLGFSQTAIAHQVGIGHATISRWLTYDAFPEQQPQQRMMYGRAGFPL